ncbi:MAG: NAD(P)(+) transhydrogenase (Re/Si-specific) subunit beta [Firmicutes bacterium]|nr:NAD(P)(+) transhydrogenase (Re/Si-specific) subunit beta [Bacillota bacterium]
MMGTIYINIIGLIFVAGIVLGIKLMSSPETAVKGNAIGAISMAGAIILTLLSQGIVNIQILWISMAIGSAFGYYLSVKVAMIQMPQMVALLNGFGGGSSAIVSLLSLINTPYINLTGVDKFTAGLGIIIGSITLSGSLIAAAKLDRRMTSKPIFFRGQSLLNTVILIIMAVLNIALIVVVKASIGPLAIILLALALFFGVIFTVRVGGADMPVTISLLNSFSGLAGAISGFAISNPLLIAVGAIVGASGLILTGIMCKAMNRSLSQVMTGKTVAVHTDNGKKPDPDTEDVVEPDDVPDKRDAGTILRNAESIIIVPGYGMALAQAQFHVKRFMDLLENAGKDVKFAIHPVAGRMPGHMNVLLAEVDVPYDRLHELETIDAEFADCDVAVVVGANDVINPAANTAKDTPIYGMPVLSVEDAKDIFILNLDTKPGYAGVDNPLYSSSKVRLFLGDAKDSLDKLISMFTDEEHEDPVEILKPDDIGDRDGDYLDAVRKAKRVIIIPGYGMALAQAQFKVKSLVETLEANNAEVKLAIHPVAGRMPGHMNVLLAEADVPYDKLFEMDEINPEFENADVAIIVGANDVVNPAARSAEGTPIYGMPILKAHEARNVIIFNLDTQPGYAGVDNPLYTQDNATLLLGNAAETLDDFINDLGL